MATKKKLTLAQARKLEMVTKGTLRQVFEVAQSVVDRALEGLEPLMSYRGGRGDVLVYDTTKAIGAVERFLEARKALEDAKRAPPPAQAAAPPADSQTAEQMFGLVRGMSNSIGSTLGEMMGANDLLHGDVKALLDQNRIIFKTMEQIKTQLELLGKDAPGADTPPPPAPFKAAPKTRVAVVGLIGHQRPLLAMKFKELDIRFFEASDVKGKDFVNSIKFCHHVFIMVGFVSHTATDAVQKSGVPYTNVTNGMTRLNEAVEAMLAQVSE